MNKLEGELSTYTFTGKQYKPGTVFSYTVYISKYYDDKSPAAIIINLDELNKEQVMAMEELAGNEKAPAFVAIGIEPGKLPPTLESGMERGMRRDEYDLVGPEFPDFLIEELIPEVCSKENLHISEEPDMHMISGGSSGALCSWNAAWYRNDYFRRVYLASPSFHAMGGAEDFPFLIRKFEPRPIRAYVTYGEDEPDGYFGSSYTSGINTVRALKYAGYEFEGRYFPSEGHMCRLHDYDVQLEALQFLWRDWKEVPVKTLALQDQINKLIDIDSTWEEFQTDFQFPDASVTNGINGVYIAEGSTILLEKKNGERTVVADNFGKITALGISSDLWRLYIADMERRYIFAMSICPDGSLKDRYILGSLHLAADCRRIGALDLCVDVGDRVYVATELGIQSMTSFGIVDAIIPLPEDLPVNHVAFEGEYLHAKSGDRQFRRRWKIRGKKSDESGTIPANSSYY